MGQDFGDDRGRAPGRDESRAHCVFPAADVVTDPGAWKGPASVVPIVSERVVNGKATREARYYISSRAATAEICAAGVRNPWGIENGLHSVLDVAFGDDASRVRVGYGPENFGPLRRLARAVPKQSADKGSIRGKRLIAGWDNDDLERILLDSLRI